MFCVSIYADGTSVSLHSSIYSNKSRMKTLISLIISFFGLVMLTACIEDGIDNSPSSQPVFSVDTLNIGTVFTGQPTTTSRFIVYNPHDKIINISSISLRSGERTFRLNVDGFAGTTFSNVEIRPNDSIYVFVEATLGAAGRPELTEFTDKLDFVTNGVTSTVVLKAEGQDVERMRGVTVTSDMRLDATYPYQIYDSLVVSPGATLTIPSGTTMHFHDKAYLRVYGSLVTEGTAESPVTFSGDRTGTVVGNIPFDLMASQWGGIHFAPGSRGNSLSHTVVKNTVSGVVADSGSQVDFINCRLRNSASNSLTGVHADIRLIGCEVAEAAVSAMDLTGGTIVANHCTFANYYLFSVISGSIVQLRHLTPEDSDDSELPYMKGDFANCIIYGLGADFKPGDLTGSQVTLSSCLLKSEGENDYNFLNCIWDEDPLYYTVRQDYYFDYRLKPESPAIAAADPSLTLPEAIVDSYGVSRLPNPNLGAYQAAGE